MSLPHLDITATYTDLYQLTMAQVYFMDGQKDNIAVFDYFFRKLPFDGGYAIFAGLEDLLTVLENLHFNKEDIEYLKGKGLHPEFLNYLKDFRFQGEIYSTREGDLVFPTRPILSVKGTIIEAQIIETVLLNILNFQTLIATKASRMREVACDGKLVDFGLRRSHALGGYSASRACMIGGFDGTSNVKAGKDYSIPVSGTMAHSFIQNYDDELTAFRTFARHHPENCVLLVDTYDTLDSGVPNAITIGLEMEKRGEKLSGIRLDSGDLAYLAREARKMLDNDGLGYVKIAVSNQLDEYVIKSLMDQGAPIDLYGVGTNLVTGQPDAKLDGVYKLCYSQGKPRIKLSENITKMNLPHQKQVFRVFDKNGYFYGADAIGLFDEKEIKTMHHPYDENKSLTFNGLPSEPVLQQVMKHGERTHPPREWQELQAFSREQMKKLPLEYRRFNNPHIYKIGISSRLKEERDQLVEEYKERS